MMNIGVDRIVRVRDSDGRIASAKVRRIGHEHHGWHMLTLDIGGEVAYAPARSYELEEGADSP